MSLKYSGRLALAWSLASLAFANPALADEAVSVPQRSSVSAVIEFPLPALESQLDDLIARRLASFDDRGSECWRRRIFWREVRIDCTYEGAIERTGGVELSAEDGRLTGAMPIYGTASARGVGRFVRRLHGGTEARLMVYATAHPRLLPDWTVALDLHEGFRWREPPVVRVLGFPIDLARYAAPAIDRELGRVRERVETNVRSLDIRGKAEHVWRQMFTPVELSGDPGLWLQITPESVSFSGLRATGRELEGSLEISGEAVATVGNEPSPRQPTPLPVLGGEVRTPGEFNVIVPVDLTFATIENAWRQAIAADPQLANSDISNLKVATANGKFAISLQPPRGASQIALTADLKAGADDDTIELEGIAPSESAENPLNRDALAALHDSLSVSFKERLDAVMASANQRLNQKLPDGFRREGHLAVGKPMGVAVLPDRIRIMAHAHGHLRFVYQR